jgi:hypothetical protein
MSTVVIVVLLAVVIVGAIFLANKRTPLEPYARGGNRQYNPRYNRINSFPAHLQPAARLCEQFEGVVMIAPYSSPQNTYGYEKEQETKYICHLPAGPIGNTEMVNYQLAGKMCRLEDMVNNNAGCTIVGRPPLFVERPYDLAADRGLYGLK